MSYQCLVSDMPMFDSPLIAPSCTDLLNVLDVCQCYKFAQLYQLFPALARVYTAVHALQRAGHKLQCECHKWMQVAASGAVEVQLLTHLIMIQL